MTDYTDLVTQAKSNDTQQKHSAFDQLMRDFQGMAYQHAYATLGNSQLAEDATQDAFLSAYQRIEQLRDPRAFPGWLKRIVYTQCDRIIRRKNPIVASIDNQFEMASDTPGPEAILEDDELRDQIQFAIDALPEHERDVTESFYLKGESQKEISERHNIPVTTVKKRLQYARQRLRGIISDLNETIDRAIDGNPPQPQPVPIYIRQRRDEDGYEELY